MQHCGIDQDSCSTMNKISTALSPRQTSITALGMFSAMQIYTQKFSTRTQNPTKLQVPKPSPMPVCPKIQHPGWFISINITQIKSAQRYSPSNEKR